MAKIKFYTDEHVSKAVIMGLRRRGVDVLTVPEAGLMGASDKVHMKRAREDGRVIFTQDDDFLKIAAAGNSNSGIVYATQAATVGEIIYGLMLIFQVLDAEEMINHIEFL